MPELFTGERQVIFEGAPRNFLTKEKEKVNFQSASILGTSNWGIPFVPKFYRTFQSDSDVNDRLNSFEINHDSFLNNHREFQGHILPYLAAYSVLQVQGQLNFTRLAGIKLNDFPNLKPGFLLDYRYNLFAVTIELEFINTHSFNYLNTETRFLQAIILTKDFIPDVISLGNNNFKLTLAPLTVEAANKTRLTDVELSQSSLQDKIFTFINDDKPTRQIKFNFNQFDKNFYWKHVLNTNLQRIDDFGYSVIYYDDIFNKIGYDINDVNITNVSVNLLNSNLKDFQEEMKTSQTPWIVSQGFYNSKQNKSRNDAGLELKDRVKKLFRIHAMCPGKLGNDFIVKITPTNLSNLTGWAQFNLKLLDKRTEQVICEFNRLNLDYDSPDFIGRVIGNQKIYFDADIKKVIVQGEFENQNPWIRVELSDDVINQNILSNTIPAGFLGVNKFKNNLFNDSNYSDINQKYVLNTQILNLTSESLNRSVDLNPNHAWGYNLKNISKFDVNIPNKKFSNFNNNFIKNSRDNINNDLKFSFIKYEMPERVGLTLNRKIDEHAYLNKNFYQSLDIDNYDDMFHLEKIVLLNEYNETFSNNISYWELARYINSGNNIDNLKLDNKFWDFIFLNNDNIEDIFYYFTIYLEENISQSDIANIIDSVDKAASLYNVNILSFNVEMTGGWDGLNLLDIDEYSINDKGLQKSPYLREIYKLGLSIINDEVNGQNDFIYLPEIFQSEVVDSAITLIEDNNYAMLLLDQPYYDINNNIIYGKQCLKLDAGLSNLQYGWSDQKYIYLDNEEVDNLKFNFNITYSNWSQNINRLNKVASFANYAFMKLLNGPQIPLNSKGQEQELLLPAGLLGLTILMSYNFNFLTQKHMNPIYNNILTGLGDIAIVDTLDDTIDINNPARRQFIRNVNNLNINLIYKDIKNGQNQFSFFSDKTQQFDMGNNSLLTKINVRNTLNYIKKLIKFSSYGILFKNAKDVKDITSSCRILYELILSKFLSMGLINNYRIKLDDTTTSKEDILMGIVRGAIYIQFNNQEIIQINV